MQTSIISGIPVYEALINDDECGMVRISLVDSPAVLSTWQAFRDEAPASAQRFSVADEEQRLVRGVVMRADFPIFRRDPGLGEYYVIYRPETIRQMAEKYLAENRQNRVDTMHSGDEVRGVDMVQFFIKDSARGISPEGFDDVADGSLFAEFHVTNDDVWSAIKAGIFMGFSLEGFFDFAPDTNQRGIDDIVNELEGRFSAEKNNRKTNMGKLEKMLERLGKMLEAGPTRQEYGRVTTDRGVLAWPGTEDLEAGDSVVIIEQDGNEIPAPNGDYMTSDGKTIVVAGGIVAEIRDPEAEVAPQEEPQGQEMAAEEAAPALEQTPVETPAMETPEAPATEAPEAEPVAEVSEPEAPVQESVDMEDLRGKLNDAIAANTALEAELEAARAEIAQLKAQPSAKPAHEEVRDAARVIKTGNKSLDRLAEIMGA